MAYTAEQLTTMLAEARAAYHELMMGNKPRVVVDQNGERVEFVAANSQKLYAYIQSIQGQLDALTTTAAPTNAPLRFLF